MLTIAKKHHVFLIYVTLALTTIVAYGPVRHNEFINYDDNIYVTDNVQIVSGFTTKSIVSAFTKPHAANWHPVTWLSHMLDCELFGLSSFWHHTMNLVFHIANTLLLFAIFKKLTDNIWPSAFVAAAFALHPLHVESVAWVAERKDVLSTFFWLLIMAAYIRYAKHPRLSSYLLVFLLLALGLMAKSMLVTLPLVLLLIDYWPLGRFQQSTLFRLIREKIPLFVLSVASSIVTFLVQKSGGAVSRIEDIPLGFRVFNASLAYVKYIGKMIYPSRLAILYPLPAKSMPIWQPVFALVLLLAVSVAVVLLARRRKYLLTGWLWYLVTLVPVIGLVQVGVQTIADRYTYVPSIGIFIIFAWGIGELSAKWRYKKIILGIMALVLFTTLIMCTRSQVKLWKNNFTLFEHTLNVTEGNYVIHGNLGGALLDEDRFDEALIHLNQALALKPNYCNAMNTKARVLLEKDEVDQAISIFKKVLNVEKDRPDTRNYLGLAYMKKGQLDLAVTSYEEAIELKPDHFRAMNNLGVVFQKQGETDLAIEQWEKALAVEPDHSQAHYNVAMAFAQKGQFDKANQHFEQYLHSRTDYLKESTRLAYSFFRFGYIELAINRYYGMLQVDPDSIDALNAAAWILSTSEDVKFRNPINALKFAQRACELTNYEDPALMDTLAAVYAAAGDFPKAIATAEKAANLAEATDKKELAQEIQSRIKLYKNNQPYIEPSL